MGYQKGPVSRKGKEARSLLLRVSHVWAQKMALEAGVSSKCGTVSKEPCCPWTKCVWVGRNMYTAVMKRRWRPVLWYS